MNDLVTIRQILNQENEYAGWLYLPPRPWTLDTKGIFVKKYKDADPESNDHIPGFIVADGWDVVLDAAGIEDVIYNAEDQISDPTEEQLFRAFMFYVDNDAFIDFSDE